MIYFSNLQISFFFNITKNIIGLVKKLLNQEISPKQKALLLSVIAAITLFPASHIKHRKLSCNNPSQIKKAQNKYNSTKAALSSISKLPKVSEKKSQKFSPQISTNYVKVSTMAIFPAKNY
ncbi:unnamed protein product [Blepharisma stoltei]|uniref:Uncharacterized protein n=1 Tax=Blepharisma stoltei TaxID=1481888 RepID=A0AAU9JG94_9CILI|nr:unnamed protein product [Blepharisma stoltei]